MFRRNRRRLFEPAQPTRSMLKAIAEYRAGKTGLDGAHYHGGCFDCVYRKNNDNRAGIEWCLGCQYSNGDWSLPDLSARLVRITPN